MWERFEASLISANLVKLVNEMKGEGLSQLEIYDRFERFRAMLRETGREKDEDAIMEILDRIIGWCSPQAKFFTHYLSNEEIDSYHKMKNADE